MDDGHIQEASAAAEMVVGFSTYFHSIGYDVEKFKEELDAAMAYIKSQSG